ncbi:CCHC-type domain-containing protein [Trichonephila clavipes]|nr:CCHC-type domain-containing protein [Trichonephila clavipes]
MKEVEKVSHLMKGVAEDIYQALLTREINDTASFIKWCNYIEDMKQKRVGRPKFERLPNVVPVASLTDETDLVSLIRTIVREEVHRLVNQTQESLDSDPQSLEEIVQDEVERVLAPVSTKPTETRPRPTYAAVTRKYRAPVQKFPPEPRKTDVWRTADNRPVCFHCGRPGHVMRYCRERKAVFDNSRNRRRNFDDVGTEEEIRRPNSSRRFYAKSHERPIPNTSLQIPVAISPIQSVARPETSYPNYSEIFWAFHEDRQVDSREDECETQNFTGDHAPINQRAYRVSPTERRIIHEEVQKMLDEGIVQPSESPWSSPVVLVRKKTVVGVLRRLSQAE